MTPDAKILAALRVKGQSGVSGSELALQLAISRAAVWARIQELRGLGYDIDASPHAGYRLIHAPDRLHADDLVSRLDPACVVGRDVRVFSETTSTNDLLEKSAAGGAAEGAVVFAELQTRGRGRLGRKWVSPKHSGLWFSILLRPMLRPQEATRITILASTALCRAVRNETGLNPQIKWPNDLLIRGRKVAGILTELSAEVDRVRHVILGIGVNVNLKASDFSPELRRTATSLQIEAGAPIDRSALAAAILRELDFDYRRLTRGEFDAVSDEWEKLCCTLGRRVSIQAGDRAICGVAESLDGDGALRVRSDHGHLERVVGGDVALEK